MSSGTDATEPAAPDEARQGHLLGNAPAAATPAEALGLVGAGAVAVLAVALIKMRLGVPGHHVALILPPVALGIAVWPRRSAGLLAGLGALLGAGLLLLGGRGLGFGALTSTLLAGPALELAAGVRRRVGAVGRGRVVFAFALAGLGLNLVALVARVVPKVLAFDGAAGKPLGAWLPLALISYPLFGLLAGAACGLLPERSRPESS